MRLAEAHMDGDTHLKVYSIYASGICRFEVKVECENQKHLYWEQAVHHANSLCDEGYTDVRIEIER